MYFMSDPQALHVTRNVIPGKLGVDLHLHRVHIPLVLLCICVVSCPYLIYFPTVMARYSLFVLKVPLNPKQTNKQTCNEQQRGP